MPFSFPNQHWIELRALAPTGRNYRLDPVFFIHQKRHHSVYACCPTPGSWIWTYSLCRYGELLWNKQHKYHMTQLFHCCVPCKLSYAMNRVETDVFIANSNLNNSFCTRIVRISNAKLFFKLNLVEFADVDDTYFCYCKMFVMLKSGASEVIKFRFNCNKCHPILIFWLWMCCCAHITILYHLDGPFSNVCYLGHSKNLCLLNLSPSFWWSFSRWICGCWLPHWLCSVPVSEDNIWDSCTGSFIDETPFLSPNQHCQSTAVLTCCNTTSKRKCLQMQKFHFFTVN